jgi:voltage-gated potassium channel
MRTQDFKKELARVFDDNLHTKQWHNYVDYAIICLILLSTAEIFISTFPISATAEKWMKGIDWFTQIFFTIEVSLRIWTADEIDPKYKGFWGRVKYCFSFYGLIDFLATYPFWFSFIVPLPVTALKSLRIMRLFRVARMFRIFRYMKAFRFLGAAIKSKKTEMLVSLQFLTIITVVLSLLLYLVEHDANPDMIGDGWKSFVWAFAKYIGDPGKVADEPIITVAGQIIAFIVGILGIAIFAVPIGLIGSGFTEAIEEQQKEEEIKNNVDKLHRAFERKQDRPTLFQVVPMYLSLADIQAKMGMTQEAIFEAVNAAGDFRVFNMASTIPESQNPADRLAVEHFVANRPYGCFIDRGSRVTIVSPASMIDPMVGNFSYYLAKIGGFNFVSRELGEVRPYKSFYLATSFDEPGQQEFMVDVNELTSREGAWCVTILAASGTNEPEYPEVVHIGYGGGRGESALDAPNLFIHDIEKADAIFTGIENTLQNDFGWKAERQMRHKSDSPNVYLRHLQSADSMNAFILRIAWSAMARDVRRIKMALAIGDVLHNELEPDRQVDRSELKIKDIGYSDYQL